MVDRMIKLKYNYRTRLIVYDNATYTDGALRQNALSVVFENKGLAKENETIYLSTHSPESLTSLRENRVMKL